jgi:hypothetical protein
MPPDVSVFDFGGGIVCEDRQGALDPRYVSRGVVDQQVDVLGQTAGTVCDDREAADEEIAGARLVQRAADPDDVRRLRRP